MCNKAAGPLAGTPGARRLLCNPERLLPPGEDDIIVLCVLVALMDCSVGMLQGFGVKQLRQQFYEKELQDYSSRISRDVEVMSSEVSSMLQSSDAILREGRELDDLFNEMLARRLSGLEDAEGSAEGSSQQAAAQRPTAEVQSVFAFDKGTDTTGSTGVDWKGGVCFDFFFLLR